MAELILMNNLQAEYVRLVQRVADHGEPASPRGIPTRELRDVTLHFADTSNLLPVGVGRGVSVKLNAYSAAALVAGEHIPAMALAIAPAVAAFDADGVDRERYGPRTVEQVIGVARHLREDPDTREAIVTLQPARTAMADGGRDFPCTTSIQFLLRDGLLHMTVSMRSNDAWHGLSGDAWVFGQLQATLAWAVGAAPGHYTHHAASLHLYDHDLPKLAKLHAPDKAGLLRVRGFRDPVWDIDSEGSDDPASRMWAATLWAKAALGLRARPFRKDPDPGVAWYFDQLQPFWPMMP